jgi:microcompartment protein CcmL/EutN
MQPALALIEFDSIAAGIEAGDAMAKKAPIAQIITGTVQQGKYLVLVAGEVADVEESLAAGLASSAGAVLDHVYLPGVHIDVVSALAGGRRPEPIDALGVVDTRTVASAIAAADAGVKGAEVTLMEVRLADGLGGRGLVFFSGLVADVEAAVRIGTDVIAGTPALIHAVVIPRLHTEMAANLLADTRWRAHAKELAGK